MFSIVSFSTFLKCLNDAGYKEGAIVVADFAEKICVKKDNPYNGVMGNEQTIYMILGIMWFVFDVLYITILALDGLN